MQYTHWSNSGKSVQILGVNALAIVPFIFWFFNLTSMILLSLAILNFIFFIIVEKVLKIKVVYLIPLVRYLIIGYKRSPKYKSNSIN